MGKLQLLISFAKLKVKVFPRRTNIIFGFEDKRSDSYDVSPGQWIESVTDCAVCITDWLLFTDWPSSHARLADPIRPMPNNGKSRHSGLPSAPISLLTEARLGDAVRTTDCNLPIASPILSTGQVNEYPCVPMLCVIMKLAPLRGANFIFKHRIRTQGYFFTVQKLSRRLDFIFPQRARDCEGVQD